MSIQFTLCSSRTFNFLFFVFFTQCLFILTKASHCYSQTSCSDCIQVFSSSASDCVWCVGTNACGMYYDSCSSDSLRTRDDPAGCPVPQETELPGVDFFMDISHLLIDRPSQRNYGVSISDITGDGKFEIFIAGNGVRNLAYKFNSTTQVYDEIAKDYPVLQDSSRKAIGVAACDIDGDGFEEIYVLNTDQYSGETTTSDGVFDFENGQWVDLFTETRNLASGNYVAGRSCACVDRTGDGVYGVMVANYGSNMKLFEINSQNVIYDAAPEAGMDKSAGGRALVAGPIVSERMDVFANNEIYYPSRRRRRLSHRDNFMFVHNGGDSGTYSERAHALNLEDENYTGRGTALLDANHDGLIDIVYGNWNGIHRLFIQSRDGDTVTFTDAAPADMAETSRIRTVIVADFDNDGYEEIFWNNIPGENRLFRQSEAGVWVRVNIGDANLMDGYGTGAAVGDFDDDGMLELIVSHGESGPLQPPYLFKSNLGAEHTYLRILPLTVHGAPARGTRVDLTDPDDRVQVRIIDAGSGYLCQMEPVAHFGLHHYTSVKKVKISWTDGSSCEFVPEGVSRLIRVTKGRCDEVNGSQEESHDEEVIHIDDGHHDDGHHHEEESAGDGDNDSTTVDSEDKDVPIGGDDQGQTLVENQTTTEEPIVTTETTQTSKATTEEETTLPSTTTTLEPVTRRTTEDVQTTEAVTPSSTEEQTTATVTTTRLLTTVATLEDSTTTETTISPPSTTTTSEPISISTTEEETNAPEEQPSTTSPATEQETTATTQELQTTSNVEEELTTAESTVESITTTVEITTATSTTEEISISTTAETIASSTTQEVIDGDDTGDQDETVDEDANDDSSSTIPETSAEWVTGQWTACSVTCGSGIQTREVDCSERDNTQCASIQRPLDTQNCHNDACETETISEEPEGAGVEEDEASTFALKLFFTAFLTLFAFV